MLDQPLTLTNHPAQVERVQQSLEAILRSNGIRLKIVSALNLALGEWLENIIQHAYSDDATHTIGVQCIIAPAEILLRVTDDGQPFDPRAHPAWTTPPGLGQQPLAGRGLHLLRHLVDRVTYERVGDQNVVTLAKSCSPRNDY